MTTEHRYRDTIERMFDWFDEIVDNDIPYDDSTVEKFWTPDSQMITNGAVRFEGYEQLNKHWRDLKGHFQSFTLHRPFRQYFESGDKVVTEYLLTGVTQAGDPGECQVMAVFTMEDGRVKAMNEVAAIEGWGRFKVGDK